MTLKLAEISVQDILVALLTLCYPTSSTKIQEFFWSRQIYRDIHICRTNVEL